jgi:hypothetical protein
VFFTVLPHLAFRFKVWALVSPEIALGVTEFAIGAARNKNAAAKMATNGNLAFITHEDRQTATMATMGRRFPLGARATRQILHPEATGATVGSL